MFLRSRANKTQDTSKTRMQLGINSIHLQNCTEVMKKRFSLSLGTDDGGAQCCRTRQSKMSYGLQTVKRLFFIFIFFIAFMERVSHIRSYNNQSISCFVTWEHLQGWRLSAYLLVLFLVHFACLLYYKKYYTKTTSPNVMNFDGKV